MPFRSLAQMRYLFARHPRIAKRWAKEYGIPEDLPEKVNKKDKKSTAKHKSKENKNQRSQHKKKAQFDSGVTDTMSNNNNTDFLSKWLETVEKVGVYLERTQQMYQEKRAEEERIADEIPRVVDALIKNGRIRPDERDEAAVLLQDHLTTLKILERTASHRTNEEVSFGHAKRAYVENNSYRKISNQMKESDKAYLRALGLEHLIG